MIDEEAQIELEKSIYEDSYYEFFKNAVQVLEPETNWQFNWHIEEACNIFQEAVERVMGFEEKQNDLSFNLPPSSSKSMIFSVCAIPWIWTKAPHIRYVTISHSRKLQIEHSRKTIDLIKSDWYQKLFGDRFTLVKANEEYIETNKKGYRMAGIQTGQHADIVVGDDLIDARQVTDAFIRQANDIWFNKVPSRFRDLSVGLKVLVMQRLAQDDPCGRVEDLELNYKHFKVPAELTEDLTPNYLAENYKHGSFWHERFPYHVLMHMKQTQGTRAYTSQYLQSPAPLEGGIIKRNWINIVNPETITRDPEQHPVYFFIDTAYTEKHENDPSAFLACFKKDNNLYITNCVEKWLEFPELLEYIKNFMQVNGYGAGSVIYIEPKASGKDIVNSLRRNSELNVAEANVPYQDKVSRLNAVSPKIESQRVHLLQGAWNQDFVEQITMQPYAKRWDMTDCFSMAIDHLLNQSQFDFMFLQ